MYLSLLKKKKKKFAGYAVLHLSFMCHLAEFSVTLVLHSLPFQPFISRLL